MNINPAHAPTPYAELNAVLASLVSGISDIVGNKLTGVYLQGSFAVGDFDEHSDCDFIVVLTASLSKSQVADLQKMHKALFDQPSLWAKHLEGSYFPRRVLQDYLRRGSKLWYLDNGSQKIVRSNHCNTVLVRQVLRDKGVVLYGPGAASLIDPIPVAVLKEEIFTVMHEWGNKILACPARYDNRFYQGFILLSYCRMLRDFLMGSPSSKKQGAEWAKAHLDAKWHDLIDRAWDCRPVPEQQVRQKADPADFTATLEFVRLILKESIRYH